MIPGSRARLPRRARDSLDLFALRPTQLNQRSTTKTMSVPDDTLRRVLQELQTQAITSNRAISQTRSIITTREREKKLLQLTRNEIGTVDEVNKGEAVYRGVGKMFVQEPLKDMLSQMSKKEKELNDDVTSLNKKLTYLEKEAAQAQAGLKELFEHQKRQ